MRMAAGEGDALINSSVAHQNPIFTSFHWTRMWIAMLPMYSIDINCSSPDLIWLNLFKVTKLFPFYTLVGLDWKLGVPTVEQVHNEPPGRYLASLAWLPKWPYPPLLWPLLSAPSSQARLSPATTNATAHFYTLLKWFEFWKRMKMDTTNSEIQSVVSLVNLVNNCITSKVDGAVINWLQGNLSETNFGSGYG